LQLSLKGFGVTEVDNDTVEAAVVPVDFLLVALVVVVVMLGLSTFFRSGEPLIPEISISTESIAANSEQVSPTNV
jgi:hypothetical protein